MRAIIDGKRYDTDTATELASHSHGARNDFGHYAESLYRTARGSYFLAGSGGPMSPYARSLGHGERTGGEAIKPLAEDEALEWCERTDNTEVAEAEFGDKIQDA